MDRKHDRVAWLLNHCVLMPFEAPLLRSLGLEVFTPGQVPRGPDAASCAVETGVPTTLPEHVLARLNAHNFYEDPIPGPLAEDLNEYFGTVFLAAYPFLVDEIIKCFKGNILIRVFGRESPRTYTELFSQGDPTILEELEKVHNRFWMAAAYDTIAEVEDDLLRSRVIELPIGIPGSLWTVQDSWYGGDRRIFFVCPKINSSPSYYGKIYYEFKKAFGDLPHFIAGDQPINVEDPNVIGFLSKEDYEYSFQEASVMFYHSQEPRHLHYHPLEAIMYGTPLIFLRGGLLERFGGADQPGACGSLLEARGKVMRLLGGDRRFAREIQSAQKRILETFTWDHCRTIWKDRFLGGVLGRSGGSRPDQRPGWDAD